MWKCEVNNPKCENGWIYEQGEITGKCKCIHVKAVLKAYHVYGKFHKKFLKRFIHLENQNIKEYDFMNDKESKPVEYQELGKKLVDNMPKLIEKEARIILYGDAGTGKSQFVSSLGFEIADKHQVLSYFLETKELWDAIFDFGDKEKLKLKEIREKVLNPKTKVLILDDLGSELPKDSDNRLPEIVTVLNHLIRDFSNKENGHCIIVTTNMSPTKLKETYKDKRLLDVLIMNGITRVYKFSSKEKFRQKHTRDELDFLD